jgi:S-adenosylhomocysteine hydrolase
VTERAELGLVFENRYRHEDDHALDALTSPGRPARGHMFNLAGPRPLGNSIESMDLGFALQARCLEAVARGGVDATSCVVPVPGAIDAAVAQSYLDRKYPA